MLDFAAEPQFFEKTSFALVNLLPGAASTGGCQTDCSAVNCTARRCRWTWSRSQWRRRSGPRRSVSAKCPNELFRAVPRPKRGDLVQSLHWKWSRLFVCCGRLSETVYCQKLPVVSVHRLESRTFELVEHMRCTFANAQLKSQKVSLSWMHSRWLQSPSQLDSASKRPKKRQRCIKCSNKESECFLAGEG